MATEILAFDDLRIQFPGAGGPPAVDGVSFTLDDGERLGMVGESGSGKSLTVLAALGLVPAGGLVSGTVRVDGRELTALGDEERRLLRGRVVGWVPQEPAASLNPTWRVGFQLAELLRAHRGFDRAGARAAAAALLAEVGLEPTRFVRAWAHQLSGGEAQRVALAMALAGEPRLLLADEPTTALDLLTQAEILELLDRAGRRHRMALVLVSHDLEVVAAVARRLVVLYAGQVVEEGPAAELLTEPWHPYTAELVAASGLAAGPTTALAPPAARDGCRFADRCPLVRAACRATPPDLEVVGIRRLRCPVRLAEHEASDRA